MAAGQAQAMHEGKAWREGRRDENCIDPQSTGSRSSPAPAPASACAYEQQRVEPGWELVPGEHVAMQCYSNCSRCTPGGCGCGTKGNERLAHMVDYGHAGTNAWWASMACRGRSAFACVCAATISTWRSKINDGFGSLAMAAGFLLRRPPAVCKGLPSLQ